MDGFFGSEPGRVDLAEMPGRLAHSANFYRVTETVTERASATVGEANVSAATS